MTVGLPPLKIIETITTAAVSVSSISYDASSSYDVAQDWGAFNKAIRLPASGTIASAAPSGSRHVVMLLNAASADAVSERDVEVRLNADTAPGADYNDQSLKGVSTTKSAARAAAQGAFTVGTIPGTSVDADAFGGGWLLLPHAFGTDNQAAFLSSMGAAENSIIAVGGRRDDASAIKSVTMVPSVGEFAAATVVELCVIDEDYAVAGSEQILTSDGTFSLKNLDGLTQQGDLWAVLYIRTDAAGDADTVIHEISADTTASNYLRQRVEGSNSSTAANRTSDNEIGEVPGDGATANAFGTVIINLSAFGKTANDPHILSMSGFHEATGPDSSVQFYSARRDNIAGVTQWDFKPNTGTNFKSGSMISLYHVPKRLIAYKELESSAASVTFDDIPQGFEDLRLHIYARSDRTQASERMQLELNGDTTAGNYGHQTLHAFNTTVAAQDHTATKQKTLPQIPASTATANVFGGCTVLIPQYTRADRHQYFLSFGGRAEEALQIQSHRWGNVAPITKMVVNLENGNNFIKDSIFMLEGINPVDGDEQGFLLDTSDYALEVDWGNGGNFDGANDNITANTLSVTTFSGRNFASQLTGKAVAGTLTAKLLNPSGLYSPFNTSGALSGSLLPGRTVRLRTLAPAPRTLWQGQLNSIVPLADNQGRQPMATLKAVGPLASMDTAIRVAIKTNITTDLAIAEVLDRVDWASADRKLDTGKTTMTRWFTGELHALNAARQVEDTEAGFLRETRDGKIAFENREHRLDTYHQQSQRTYTDAAGTTKVSYSQILQVDSLPLIFNDFRASVRLYEVAPIAVVWIHPEAKTTGSTAPEIGAGNSITFFATIDGDPEALNAPLLAAGYVAIDAWTNVTATTDLLANSAVNGSGSDVTSDIAITIDAKFDTAMKFTLKNNGSASAFITFLQARGTGVIQTDSAIIQAEDSTSQTTFGLREFPLRSAPVWIPTSDEANGWVNTRLGIYKDPTPIIKISPATNRSLLQLWDAITRGVSDRITITATGSVTEFGVNEDFFIEAIRHNIVFGRSHRITFDCSAAGDYSDFWVMDFSKLGSGTRLFY